MTIKKQIKTIEKDIKKVEKTIEKDIKKVEKAVETDIKYAEKWMHERKKFLVKLAWVLGLIIFLLIISNVYMKVKGFG
jgi:hypothetical protein